MNHEKFALAILLEHLSLLPATLYLSPKRYIQEIAAIVPGNYPIMSAKLFNHDRDRTIIEYGITKFSGKTMDLFFSSMNN